MRLWTLHPAYLDARGLVALWREALLAQKVLLGRTRGYRHHPQLERFRIQSEPVAAIGMYLRGVHAEAERRGYRFDASKIHAAAEVPPITATSGQLCYEWRHLLAKLQERDPPRYEQQRHLAAPEPHPSFRIEPGPVAPWERLS